LTTKTKKCKVQKETPFIFRITLIQGLNRQIRRMCSYFGYEVVKLERVRIMNITLKGLPLGDWRDFTEEEVKDLMKMLERSSSTPRKERSFSKNREFRKSSPSDSRGRDDRPRPKSNRFIKKKAETEPTDTSIKSKKPTTTKKGKPVSRSLKGKNSPREDATPKKWKSETKTKSTPTKKSPKVSKPTKDKSASKASANPKSFKSYRQKSTKR
jgi:23S rRNA pseudouridine2604 synthase